MTWRPCTDCGEPSPATRCPDCGIEREARRGSASSRGYDAAWARLSARARRLQPFCTDCGATENLTVDHTPEAWQRKAQGKAIRLCDVAVVCGPCNTCRGPARGRAARTDHAGGGSTNIAGTHGERKFASHSSSFSGDTP